MTPIAGLRAAVKPNDAERSSKLAGVVPASSYVADLRAELIGTDRATALGVEAHGPAPVLALCRDLVEAGHDPATPLHARMHVNSAVGWFLIPAGEVTAKTAEAFVQRLTYSATPAPYFPTGWHQQTKTILNFAAAAARRAARIAVTIGQKRR